MTSVMPLTMLAAKEAPKAFISSIEKDFSTLSSFSLISSFKSFLSFLSSFSSFFKSSMCFSSLPIFLSSFFSDSFISATLFDFSKVTSPFATIVAISSALKPEFSSALYNGSSLNSFTSTITLCIKIIVELFLRMYLKHFFQPYLLELHDKSPKKNQHQKNVIFENSP